MDTDEENHKISFNNLIAQINSKESTSTVTTEQFEATQQSGQQVQKSNRSASSISMNEYKNNYNPVTKRFPSFQGHTVEGYRFSFQNIGTYINPETKLANYTIRLDIFDGRNSFTKVFSSNYDAIGYTARIWNSQMHNDNVTSLIKNLTDFEIGFREIVRPNGNLLVLENGSKVLAGIKLKQYIIIINGETGAQYNVCTETDIINNLNGNMQRALWLSDKRLSLKTQNYEGYIGELRPTGEIIKSSKIIDAIEHGYNDVMEKVILSDEISKR